jgi:hypothetical protein
MRAHRRLPAGRRRLRTRAGKTVAVHFGQCQCGVAKSCRGRRRLQTRDRPTVGVGGLLVGRSGGLRVGAYYSTLPARGSHWHVPGPPAWGRRRAGAREGASGEHAGPRACMPRPPAYNTCAQRLTMSTDAAFYPSRCGAGAGRLSEPTLHGRFTECCRPDLLFGLDGFSCCLSSPRWHKRSPAWEWRVAHCQE